MAIERGCRVTEVQRSGEGEPLVQRERELAVLDAALQAAQGGAGHAVLLEGGAGLGKSRLLTEAATRGHQHGVQVLRARALESEQDFSFAVALQLLEAVVAGCQPAERALLLAGAAGLAQDLLTGKAIAHDARLHGSSFSTLHGLYWVIVNLTRRGPILVCVDDLHWADEASVRLLSYLAARLDELPVALVVAARPRSPRGEGRSLAALRDALARGRAASLAALDPVGVKTVVRASFGAAEDGFCAMCAEVSGGNPFGLGELLLALARESIAPTAASMSRVRTIGATLRGRAAVFRLVRLGPEAIALARAVAVLGDGAPLRRAAALAELGLPPAAVAADALATEGILAPAPALAFTHPLIHEQIYHETPSGQRGIAHLRAARLLADEQVTPEMVAAQLMSAPPSGAGWVVDALSDAAGRARGQGAPEAAAHYLRRALQEPPAAESRCWVLRELGAAETAAGLDGDVEHLRAALELEVDPNARVATTRLLGRALRERGRAREAAEVLEDALDELGDCAGDLGWGVLADYLTSAVFEPGVRQRAVARAAPLLRAVPDGSTAAQRSLLAAMAMRSGQQGDPVTATIALAERAWGAGALLQDEGPDGTGWLMVVWALVLSEAYERAEAVTAAVIEAARRVGSPYAFATASYHHGDACYRQGKLAEAQADAEQAIETARAGWRRYLVAAIVLKANVLIDRGEPESAALVLADAAPDEHGNLDVAWLMHASGRVKLVASCAAEALALFEQAGRWLGERLGAEHTVLPWRVAAAEAALATGEPARARELIEPALAHAEQAGAGVVRGRRLRLLGLIEGGERGLELLERSVATLSATEARLEHAHALTDLGSALRRARRRGDARGPLREALDLAHRLGATALAGRARQELIAAGARPRRDPIAGTDSLTPSERRVAQLAAQGMTNPQIAQSLFVTPKTVEFHLRHVYQKLAIDGRRELADALCAPQGPTVG